jgi:hypothetical protein
MLFARTGTGLVPSQQPTGAFMIGALLRFEFAHELNEAKIQQIAAAARSKFEGLAGLRSKAFTYDRGRMEAINFYVWETEAAARD